VSTVEDAHTPPPAMGVAAETGEPRRRRRRLVWPVLGVVLIAGGAGAWVWAANGATGPSPTTATRPVATATVERGTISATESWDGTLGHGKPLTVIGFGQGMITRLAEQGKTVERGDELFRVNEQPVTLLYGAVPMYRDLRPGTSGADVRQLEANLARLGYDGFSTDDDFTLSTANAVRRWQADIGAAATGTVSRSTVVFMLEGGRIDSHRADVGALVTPGRPVVDITGTEQVVSFEAEVEDRNRFDIGTKVTVGLPDDEQVPGTVSSLRVARAAPSDSATGPEGGALEPASIAQIEVTLDKAVGEELIGAPVEVIVAVEKRTDVLLVPVNALLALAEGGYGLEIVRDDGTTSIVPVTTGLFADGKVQVEGDGIAEGTVVGVAGR
jgi:peptidoglycan hydrolase-like protein with peptidoglycan-binding domain